MNNVISFRGDPFAVVKKFHGRKGLFFLDSSQTGAEGRFSYAGFAPFKIVQGRDLRALRKEWIKYRRPAGHGFTGGAVGCLGYDGTFYFGLYDQVLVFDHRARTIAAHARTRAQLDDMMSTLQAPVSMVPRITPLKSRVAFKSNFTRAGYMAAVKKALGHIRRGDIYQINLSRKVEVRIKNWRAAADALAIYSVLRERSPSPFASYFQAGGVTVLSSSPERFLKLSGKTAEVKPMKGTRPRGSNARDDARFRNDLLRSPKEIAELLMVTDLERNDLGRVCSFGSVRVKSLRAIEAYQQVFQATATIEGTLAPGKDAFDLIAAAFPGGSVTGCPKIEAMRIIKNLEKSSRELYTGALGYIGFDGNMDFSVLIRSIFLKPDTIEFYVGGGIVADSDPALEYEETCVKAAAMQATLTEVFAGV